MTPPIIGDVYLASFVLKTSIVKSCYSKNPTYWSREFHAPTPQLNSKPAIVDGLALLRVRLSTPSLLQNLIRSRTNHELIQNLKNAQILNTGRIIDAFNATDRGTYVPRGARAYEDAPQILSSNGTATISAPHMHAHVAELLEPYLKEGNSVLDIGCGSGFLVALFSNLVSPPASLRASTGKEEGGNGVKGGKVVGVDFLPDLTSLTTVNLSKTTRLKEMLKSGEIEIHTQDGHKGFAAHAPYSAIHVGAAPDQIPVALIEQLARPGRMVIPVGKRGSQVMLVVDKDVHGKVVETEMFGVMYVPLEEVESLP